MATHRTKMLIIGSGPAGYSAAIYGARAMLEPIMVQGLQPGGQLTITTDVENYPGFADVIQGPWLMEQMRAQAEHVGTRMMWDTIVEIGLKNGSPFRAVGDSGDEYVADVLVIATGAQAKWLGVPGEQELGGLDGSQVDRHIVDHVVAPEVDRRLAVGDLQFDIFENVFGCSRRNHPADNLESCRKRWTVTAQSHMSTPFCVNR